MIRLTLPLPPSANRMWRKAGRVVYRHPDYNQFCKDVGDICMMQRVTPIAGNVQATMRFYFARVNGDLDNRIKPLLDSLKVHAYADDQQVMAFCCERHIDKKQPRVEIELQEAK